VRDEFRLAHLDGGSFPQFLRIPTITCNTTHTKASDADAADELSVSPNGNQQDEDRNEGNAKLLGSFQTQVWCLNDDGCTRVKIPKEGVRR
jgi:hypothetical protein